MVFFVLFVPLVVLLVSYCFPPSNCIANQVAKAFLLVNCIDARARLLCTSRRGARVLSASSFSKIALSKHIECSRTNNEKTETWNEWRNFVKAAVVARDFGSLVQGRTDREEKQPMVLG